MPVTFEQFLVRDPLDTEDPEKYQKFVPKLNVYKENLKNALKPELTCDLPAPIEELREKQFNAIEYSKKLLTSKESEIISYTSEQLLEKYSSGSLTVTEVYKCYAKRATIAHQFTNCVLDLFTDEGFERAEYLDEYFKKTGKLFGPFHGIPISLKEHLSYKGRITHSCYVAYIDSVPNEDCVTVNIIRKLGAVFYVRTNQPQSLMHGCSGNNYIGFSNCPYNISLTSGGSSSGEGSLVSFGGSVIGIGSDIGGSIRIPAAFSGCYGFKPTSKRVSLWGSAGLDPGQESVVPVSGPLSRSIDDIDYFMKSYVNNGKVWEHDPDMIRLEWKSVSSPCPTDLKIAIIYDDGIVRPTPPVLRGINHIAAKLKSSGVNVVDFKPIKTQLAFETVLKMYTADGNAGCKEILQETGEPLLKLTKWFLNLGTGKDAATVTENRAYNTIRNELRKEYTDYMLDNGIDFIISPASCNVAPKPGDVYYFGYTALQNILDFPSLTIQSGLFADPGLDKWEEVNNLEFRSPLEELTIGNYDSNNFKNAPIAAQLFGRRYCDEDVIAAGKTVAKILDVNLLK